MDINVPLLYLNCQYFTCPVLLNPVFAHSPHCNSSIRLIRQFHHGLSKKLLVQMVPASCSHCLLVPLCSCPSWFNLSCLSCDPIQTLNTEILTSDTRSLKQEFTLTLVLYLQGRGDSPAPLSTLKVSGSTKPLPIISSAFCGTVSPIN